MVGDATQNQMDGELVAWLDGIPFSRPARNLTRDFSDAVLAAELLKFYYPGYVELHNYVPASSLNTKRENWNTLNRKVLAKLNMKLNKNAIYHLANASQDAIEKLLSELKVKVRRDYGVEIQKQMQKHVENNIENVEQMSKEKIEDSDTSHPFNLSEENSAKLNNVDNEICQSNVPKSNCLKRGILIVLSWITSFFRILNILNYRGLPSFGKRNIITDRAIEQIENVSDETVPRAIYAELKQELREKEEMICTLNHKIVYLESSMKLKESRISSLTAQILQNTVGMDHSAKSLSNDGARTKLHSRSHNFCESKTN